MSGGRKGDCVDANYRLLMTASLSLKSFLVLPLRISSNSYSAPRRARVSQTVGLGMEPSWRQRMSASTVIVWGEGCRRPRAMQAEVRTFQKWSRSS